MNEVKVRSSVMVLDIWENFKAWENDLSLVVPTMEDIYTDNLVVEERVGQGTLEWIEDNGEKVKKHFQCDCLTWCKALKALKIATQEEASEFYEMKKKQESSKRFNFNFMKKKEPRFTLVRKEGLYAIFNKDSGSIEAYFARTTEKKDYHPRYEAQRGGSFYARGVVVITPQ